jgi:hypothetical protein
MIRLLEKVYITDKSRYCRPRLARFDCVLFFEGEPMIDEMNSALGSPNALAVWKSKKLPVHPYEFLEKIGNYEPRPNRDCLIFADAGLMAELIGHTIKALYPRIDAVSYGEMFACYASYGFYRALQIPFYPMPEAGSCNIGRFATVEHLEDYSKNEKLQSQTEVFVLEKLFELLQSGANPVGTPRLEQFIEEMMRARVYVELPIGGEHYVNHNLNISNRKDWLRVAKDMGIPVDTSHYLEKLGINRALLGYLVSHRSAPWI